MLTLQYVNDLQRDLARLNEWMVRWQVDLNLDKCRVMNIGRENSHNRYNISKITLDRSECERYLDVQISSDLRPRKQCIEARNRANRVLGFIVRSIKCRSAEVILKLYLVLDLTSTMQCSFGSRIIEWI